MAAGLAFHRLYEGTLSGGSYEPTLPLDNALVRRLSAYAQTTDALLASTLLNRDYGAPVTLRLFALRRPNLQATSKWRIIGSNNADLSAPQYDSDWIDCWPEQWAANVLEPWHPNYSTRKFTNEQILRKQWDVVHIAPADVTARYWRIALDVGVGATITYVRFAFLIMAPLYIPGGSTNMPDNLAAGLQFGWQSTADVGYSLSGVRGVTSRQKRRTFMLEFPETEREETYSVMHDMLDDLGIDEYVYFVLDPTIPHLLQRTSMLAQVAELTAVEEAAYDAHATPIKLLEVL